MSTQEVHRSNRRFEYSLESGQRYSERQMEEASLMADVENPELLERLLGETPEQGAERRAALRKSIEERYN